MNFKRNILFIGILFFQVVGFSVKASNIFSLNALGYLPDQPKIASVLSGFEDFSVVDAENGQTVLTGKLSAPVFQDDVQQTVQYADFSPLKERGIYYLQINDTLRSPVFSISPDVYKPALYTSMRAFYLWRCGTAVEGVHNGIRYAHDACHMEDGWLDSIGIPGQQRDGTGGWHDAGDHGKYVVNAGITVGMMFMAWEHFNDQLKDFDFGLPETAPGYPDYLKELKWETDWLLKMAYPDGSGRISHKLTRTAFAGFIMPEDDTEKRYFTEWSSAATASFTAMMAQAARYFKPYDATYAQKCLDAALHSYRFLKENPDPKRFTQPFRTGGYHSHDADDRLWAAVELWETTGDPAFLSDFEKRISEMDEKVDENWDWPNVRNMAVFAYLLSKREGKNQKLYGELKEQTLSVANQIVGKAKKDIYGRPLGERYYWGCNGTVVRQVLNLQVANRLEPKANYISVSLDALNNVFGRNQYGRSFVTGLGHQPPMNPHDRRSGADDIEAPWPGYIVGGGQKATDWKDEQGSFSTNEVAINWQAALVYALAGFVE
ncbi:MAG TPA: glycoside hydrolase family 9 protein [Prolixibacteraceae bacterium]|nr:glycoside hydrolase family 9 protein [Prolixibacteraceae bacterium]